MGRLCFTVIWLLWVCSILPKGQVQQSKKPLVLPRGGQAKAGCQRREGTPPAPRAPQPSHAQGSAIHLAGPATLYPAPAGGTGFHDAAHPQRSCPPRCEAEMPLCRLATLLTGPHVRAKWLSRDHRPPSLGWVVPAPQGDRSGVQKARHPESQPGSVLLSGRVPEMERRQ